jgi:phage tail-like protein
MTDLRTEPSPAIIETGRGTLAGYVPLWMEERSKLLQYLPGLFSEGEESSFLARYLLIFETIFESVDLTISHLAAYFASDTAPEEFLSWLASWVGLVIDDGWPVERRRAVLANAMELHCWRGTIRGLTDHLMLYTGIKPEIIEGGSGFKLGRRSRLGHQLMLGSGDRSNHFSVIFRVDDVSVFDRNRVSSVIEAQRPAHCTYALFVMSKDEPNGVEATDSSSNRGEADA